MSKNNSHRDQLANLSESGVRRWIYAKLPKGKLYRYRSIVGYGLILFLIIMPLIKVNGDPLILLNILERKFIIFGTRFWPQDFHLFFVAGISTFIFVVLFTVSYGRIWCGWLCPQTVFMELVFRRIEVLIEGKPSKRRKLDRQAWGLEKFIKKTSKHIIFFSICFFISNIFLSYIIGIDSLIEIMKAPISDHSKGFGIILLFSFVMYFVFAKMREQVCCMICPYGRLQGVLLDSNTINVIYDYKRGGNIEQGDGDCINCFSCVDVCPTGIDIRDGIQLECINCTACIDECNSIMTAIKKPEGLIRYASETQIEKKTHKKWPVRKIAYSILFCVLISILTGMFMNRSIIETTILRSRGTIYQRIGNDKISNIYRYNLVNKSNEDGEFVFKLKDSKAHIENNIVIAKKSSISEGILIIKFDKKNIEHEITPLEIIIYQGEKIVDKISTTFIAPKNVKK